MSKIVPLRETGKEFPHTFIICMENMWLATDEVGLGGVWMGIAPLEDRMEKVEKIIGIPESQRAFGIFALGYPAEERTQQDRYDETRIHRVTRG